MQLLPPAVLSNASTSNVYDVPGYDPQLDSLVNVLRDITSALDEAGFQFRLEACGQGEWPVDVRTDLVVVLEQLPELMLQLAGGNSGRIDLFEQGVERVLLFHPRVHDVRIECRPLVEDGAVVSAWDETGKIDLATGLHELVVGFRDAATQVYPGAGRHPWFVEFCQALMKSASLLARAWVGRTAGDVSSQ